jgi:hypothetical protein
MEFAGKQLDPVFLDQQVDGEGASGLSLAAQAVAAVDVERVGRKAVAHGSAPTATLTSFAHDHLQDEGWSPHCGSVPGSNVLPAAPL